MPKKDYNTEKKEHEYFFVGIFGDLQEEGISSRSTLLGQRLLRIGLERFIRLVI